MARTPAAWQKARSALTSPAPSTARTWALACALLIALSGAVWLASVAGLVVPEHLAWRAEDWTAAPWTLWTGPLVHFLLPHALANMLALAALGALGTLLPAQPRDALALLLAWPLTTQALLLWPQVVGYYGLASLAHAAAAILAISALSSPASHRIGQWLGIGLLIKLALERGWDTPVGFENSWGFNIVFAAHLTGALAGAAMALIVQAFMAVRKPE